MAPRDHLADGYKDLLQPSGAGESSLAYISPAAAALSCESMGDASDEQRVGEDAAVDDERENARRILALCDLAERGTSASLSSSVSAAGEQSPSPGAQRESRGAEMLRRLSSGAGVSIGDLVGSVLAATADCEDTAVTTSSHSSAQQHCSHCQSTDSELASLRATVEGLRSDLQRMTQRHDEDTAEMAKLRADNEELSRRNCVAEDESRRLRDIVGNIQAKEDWMERENETLRRRLEAGSSNVTDAVVELSDMAALENDLGEEGEDEGLGTSDGSAIPDSYFNRTKRRC